MIAFVAHGQPVAQGSTRAFMAGGRPRITSTAGGLDAWRRLVADAAQPHATMHTGPVGVELAFLMPRPKSLPKRRPTPHTRRPDLDKLCRSVLDALTGVMVSDDSQVIRLTATKHYAQLGGPVGVAVRVGAPDDAGFLEPFPPSTWMADPTNERICHDDRC